MGNQLQRSRSEEREFSQSTQTNESSNAPPRPFKPAHLQRTRVETLPVGGSDPRAFFLPVGNSVLQYNESPSTSVGQSLAESGVYEIVDHKDIDSESMPINELIDEYGPLLPLRFCVSDSLYGVCEESSLMEGQLLSVLFEKETKVALAKANQGAEYIVPLNSALLFSVLHNPQNKIETGKKGYKFPKVSDIMDATDMPQAVAVMKAFQCESNGNILLIMEGHVLIVKGIQEGEDGQRKLKCYVLGNKIEVLLNENIVGEFTTATSMLKLKLSDFIDHVTLPICVILENSKHQKIQLPLHTTVGSYTIIDQRKERSVVVSTAYGNKRETIEILLSVPIEAHLVKSSEQQLHLLRTETQPFYKSFHPSKLDKVIIDSNSSMNYIQSMLFKVVPEDDTWMYGVDIFPPQPPSSSFAINQEDADDYLEMSMERSFTPPPLSSHGRLPVPLPRHLPTSAPQSPPTRKSQPRPQLKPLRTNQQSNTNDDDDDDDDADYEFIDGRPPMPVPARAINQPLPPLIPPLIPPLENTSIPIPKARSTDLQLDPVPYMIAKETESGSLVHEAPYQYVKLSVERTRELELLRQKLTELETTNTQLTSHIQELKGETICTCTIADVCY